MPRRRKKQSEFEKLFSEPLFVAAFAIVVVLLLAPWVWKVIIAIAIACAAFVYIVIHQRKLQLLRELGLDEIDKMDGKAFEERMWIMFKDLGYEVAPTPYSGDYGADLIITMHGIRTSVQLKRYTGTVGLESVQQAVTARARYGCGKSMVVTNSSFTRQAKELARDNSTELWDRQELSRQLARARKRTIKS